MAQKLSEQAVERLTRASRLLYEADAPLNVLDAIAWPADVARAFFDSKETRMPTVAYDAVDTSKPREALAAARDAIDGQGVIQDWLNRAARDIENTIRLIEARGTREFFELSKILFGEPKSELRDGKSRTLDLARTLDGILSEYSHSELFPFEQPEPFTAEDIKTYMEPKVERLFGDEAPKIEVVDTLSAKATADVGSVKLRSTAPFTELDARQLLHHEAFVHIATSLNGRAQSRFPVLGADHGGTVKTQEGLAVFAELVSGSMDPRRMRRLADRVLAIQMAIDGADFMELYRFYSDRSHNEFEAFENTRRILRGGLLEGGAPFTKDGVYLEGLIEVDNFLRVVLPTGDTRYIRLLFCGKIDLEDITALLELDEMGLLEDPKYLPPWARDLRFLVATLSYSSFVHGMDIGRIRESYGDMFRNKLA